MPKQIVICCDGTGNEFGDQNSNVIKLYQTLARDQNQIAYYHPGVGTMGSRNALTGFGKWWTKVVGLAFGYGISDNVADAYLFLMRRYQPGDQVYVFGFSRGAYTARAFCGMLHIVGLLSEDNEALIPYAIRMLKGNKIDFKVAADFKKTFSRDTTRGRNPDPHLNQPAQQRRDDLHASRRNPTVLESACLIYWGPRRHR